MDVHAVAAELYGLPLEDFVRIRAERVKDAKADGDTEAGARVAAMRKPTMPAWWANQLARREQAAIEELLSLGDQLRTATATGDAAAQAAAASADVVVDELTARHREGERVVKSGQSLVARLAAELAAAQHELERARSTARLADHALGIATEQARSAREEVHAAQQSRDRLDAE